ncbi:MAG: cell division protein FtsQ/DivIB [Burkholderiales bacterium]|nr:MAG: cell division protein FtsQ/DivIB [Burkholderiales bacterium]
MSPWHNARALNLLANGLLALALAAAGAAAALTFARHPSFTLRSIELRAGPASQLVHVSLPALRSAAGGKVAGNFFSVDLQAVRARFEAAPWVRRASVRRIWPDRLVVQLEEHRPVAIWSDGRLVNSFGELFSANVAELEEVAPLPELAGPPGTEAELLARWQALTAWLAPLRLVPQALELSDRYAWSATLEGGSRLLLGREQGVAHAERVARMVDVMPQVVARLGAMPAVIDLRYPNGFAVRAPGKAQPAGSKPGARPAATIRSQG